MDIHIGIVNQRLKLRTNVKSIATDNRKFIRFVFDLPNDWDGLEVVHVQYQMHCHKQN